MRYSRALVKKIGALSPDSDTPTRLSTAMTAASARATLARSRTDRRARDTRKANHTVAICRTRTSGASPCLGEAHRQYVGRQDQHHHRPEAVQRDEREQQPSSRAVAERLGQGTGSSSSSRPLQSVVYRCHRQHVGRMGSHGGHQYVARPLPRWRCLPEQREQRESRRHERRAEQQRRPRLGHTIFRRVPCQIPNAEP